jgi:4-hydroxythreonine-4-phosphate dehydrogenase
MNRTRIAVTMGDPAGIGPEICLRLLNTADVAAQCIPIVFGDAGVLRRVAQKLNLSFSAPIISKTDWPAQLQQMRGPCVLDLQQIDDNTVTPGHVDAHCGEAAFQYVIAGINAGLAGEVDTNIPVTRRFLPNA